MTGDSDLPACCLRPNLILSEVVSRALSAWMIIIRAPFSIYPLTPPHCVLYITRNATSNDDAHNVTMQGPQVYNKSRGGTYHSTPHGAQQIIRKFGQLKPPFVHFNVLI
jgi:hypothetical protein